MTPKQTTDSIRKVNATYVSKAIPDKHSMHQNELLFSSIQDGSSCKAALEFSTWRFRRRLIFAVFGRRLIALTSGMDTGRVRILGKFGGLGRVEIS